MQATLPSGARTRGPGCSRRLDPLPFSLLPGFLASIPRGHRPLHLRPVVVTLILGASRKSKPKLLKSNTEKNLAR